MFRKKLTMLLAAAVLAAQQPPAQTAAAGQATADAAAGGSIVLNLPNASLTEVIDILAARLKINYILDPRVKSGTVTLRTFGEIKAVDIRSLLETILRINGAAMIQVGEIYRIVPVTEAGRLPMNPQTNLISKEIPSDESMTLNLIFLKYMGVGDIMKLIDPFRGEGSSASSYEPANLLMLLDNNRNMRRTMELIALFDSDKFAANRVRLFEVKNSRPSEISKELESVFKAYAFSEKSTSIKFMAVDRINTIIATAPNAGVFTEVESWIKKLDIPVKVTAGATDNYVYRVRYGRAEMLAMAIMQLYGGLYLGLPMMGFGGMGGGMGMGMGGGMGGMYGGGMGGMYGGGMGGMYGGGMGGMYGGGMGGMYGGGMGGMYGGGMGGMYGGGLGGMYGGMGGMGSMNYGAYSGAGMMQPGASASVPLASPAGASAAGLTHPSGDLTGSFLGAANAMAGQLKIPRVVPNPFDNSLLIQGTPSEYEQIAKLLDKLDVPPRQVLIEAKIYEVSLTGAFASGIQSFLQKRGADRAGNTGILSATMDGARTALSTAHLVGQTKELLLFLSAQEDTRRAKVVSSPSIIATESISAQVNVGSEVPTLSASAPSGVQVGGNSVFANSISNRNSGVTLNITAHVLPSGIVTMMINQEVSSPVAPAASAAIQSPSFSKRNVSTQVTVQDGDTIAIAGIIQESDTMSSAGIPVLNKLPLVGSLFGNRSYSKERTELIVFMTPRVIYDTNEITEATEELKSRLKRIHRLIKD
ncbi:MAG: type II secretion system secretin GspD [Candidatus Solibacter usitatus]|nr:type II secretion system secretin GspD [Candidatus Solibacter usitatus]